MLSHVASGVAIRSQAAPCAPKTQPVTTDGASHTKGRNFNPPNHAKARAVGETGRLGGGGFMRFMLLNDYGFFKWFLSEIR